MKQRHLAAVLAAVLAGTTAVGIAQGRSTKDIVIDQVTAPVLDATSTAARQDALAASVLVEAADGTLTPRSTEGLFQAGERMRVKVLASRAGSLAIYNTTPAGVLKPEPIWRGSVLPGQETITPRMVITNHSGAGEDLLHVVLEPAQAATGVFAWLGQWISASKSAGGQRKDIQLDVQATPTTTYVAVQPNHGLVATVRIAHR